MSFSSAPRVPTMPTLPSGEVVAQYTSYAEAQRAVDHLSDKEFPVQLVSIVGNDLKMVERVIGRLTYPKVALSGFASGAWFGLMVGWLLGLFSGDLGSTILAGLLIGGAFGMLWGVIAYAFTGGKRDFTSSSQIVASSYAVVCASEKAHQARAIISEVGAVVGGWGTRPAPTAPVQTAPAQPPVPPQQPYAAPQQQAPQQPYAAPQKPTPQQPAAPQASGEPQAEQRPEQLQQH